MASRYYKTKYEEDIGLGHTEEKTLYAHYHTCSDYLTVYDDNGDVVLCVLDSIDNNIIEAILRLYKPYKPSDGSIREYTEGVKDMSEEDIKKIKH